MKRAITGIVALVLLCPDAFGQVYGPYQLNPYNPYGPNPYGPILVQPSTPAPYLPPPQKTAREKRAERDKAVAYIGEDDDSRSFIESCDEASDAALGCSQPVAAKLAAFHCSGQLGKLPRPRELLSVIAQQGNGNDVALFAIQHGHELEDEPCFSAFVDAPLDFALGLKTLSQGAAEVKARRDGEARNGPLVGITDWKPVWCIGGVAAVIALLLWKIRQRRRAAALGA